MEYRLSYGVMVAQQILVLFVKVRILVGQRLQALEGLWGGVYIFIERAHSSAGLEHLSYKQRVIGSNPIGPTTSLISTFEYVWRALLARVGLFFVSLQMTWAGCRHKSWVFLSHGDSKM